MRKKIRLSIRSKISIMSMATIALAATSLGAFLLVQFSNTSTKDASNTLTSVSVNASEALNNSIQSLDTSMNLLVNQIGYNSDFADNIIYANTSIEALNKVRIAMGGAHGTGDGSTIIGALDYLILGDNEIESADLYSPFIDDSTDIYGRLMSVNKSKVPFSEEKYQRLKDHPGHSMWFFMGEDNLYVWKALVNYGVSDTYYMQVVGYIEYSINKAGFLSTLTESAYQNEGMYLYDENNTKVLGVSSGLESVDTKVLNSVPSFKEGLNKNTSYTAYVSTVSYTNWKYVSFINHRSIEKSNAQGLWITVTVVLVSVLVSAFVAFLLCAKDIKRIKNLSKAASEISDGNYSVQIQNSANDEITDVSDSFNVMAGKIQEALTELIVQQDSISENFATILSNKSGESGYHVKRVSEYSAILAEELGFNESEVHDIRIASMLHDVGKIMVDESILHKPGKFTDEEYKIMQQHVVYGGQLLKGVPGNIMRLGAIIAEHHHERYDGNGYVKGLKGEEIPKEAQITSVADVFDALVSKRCYKNAWTIEQAHDEIVSQSGKQFAPDVVEAFKRRFEDFKKIAEKYKEE